MSSPSYPLAYPHADGTELVENDEDLAAIIDDGRIDNDSLLYDSNRRPIRAIDFPNYRAVKRDKWVGAYENMILWAGAPALVFGLWLLFTITFVDDMALLPMGIVTAVLAFIGSIAWTCVGWSKLGYFPWSRSFFQSFFSVVALVPIAVVSMVGVANCRLDFGATAEHAVTVLDKSESHKRGRRGRRTDTYTLYVTSWRTDMPRIPVKVPLNKYRATEIGTLLLLRTKPGLFGFEHYVESPADQ